MNNGVVAIVVAFNSDLVLLTKSLFILTKQCVVVVVDNSTQSSSREHIRVTCEKTGAFWLPLCENFGIAHAQNVGITWSRERGAIDILLMDDDSIPTESLVVDLLNARNTSQLQPVVVSARTVTETGKDISNCGSRSSVGLTPCGELTSSGTLISLSIFDRIGVFKNHLFIDCVDFEWGWRALAAGIPLMLCNSAAIQHRLGEATRLGLRFPSPIRHYYQYRNVSVMLINSKAPFRWRFFQLVKLPVKFVLILLVADRRIDRLLYIAWGMYDFIIGRSGKFNH